LKKIKNNERKHPPVNWWMLLLWKRTKRGPIRTKGNHNRTKRKPIRLRDKKIRLFYSKSNKKPDYI